MPADAAIKAALDAAEDAALRYLWQHDGGYDPAELTSDRIAQIRSYGIDSGWNIKSACASATIAAFLTSMAEAGVSLAHMHDWHDLAARVQEAAKDG